MASRGQGASNEKNKEPQTATTPTFHDMLSPVEAPAGLQPPALLGNPLFLPPAFDEPVRGVPTVSTGKSRKVMDWFRKKSLAKSDLSTGVGSDKGSDITYSSKTIRATPQVVVTTPSALPTTAWPGHRVPSGNSETSGSTEGPAGPHSASLLNASLTAPTLSSDRPSTLAPTFNKALIRIHRGTVTQSTITSGNPPEVFAHVTNVLRGMGMELTAETPFKYRCVRYKRRKDGHGAPPSSSVTAMQLSGSAASNGVRSSVTYSSLMLMLSLKQVDKRGLPLPSQYSISGTGGMLKGFLLRRGSSQVSGTGTVKNHAQHTLEPNDFVPFSPSTSEAPNVQSSDSNSYPVEPVYGDPAQDTGDEVRFSVELTRVDRLEDTYSLDIRRLKGHLRSYKFLYDTVRE